VQTVEVSGREFTQACGAFYDDVADGKVSVRSSSVLDAAVAGAARRTSGDAWAWTRRKSAADISPLVSATLALWVATRLRQDYDVLESVW
jgi:hypothetical protein